MMIQKNKSPRTELLKYGLYAPLFVLMLILSAATVSGFQKPKPPVPTLKTSVDNTDPKNPIYNLVEKFPSFVGGPQAMIKFLNKNIKYPAADKESNTAGRVMLQFVIEKDGSLTSIQSLRSPSQTMANEAIRVMKLSPKWKPGLQNGRPVRARFTIPINFTLQES